MIYAFPILVLFALAFWYVIEDLRELLAEQAAEVGVDGTSPLELGLANPGHGMTATVDADTPLETL